MKKNKFKSGQFVLFSKNGGSMFGFFLAPSNNNRVWIKAFSGKDYLVESKYITKASFDMLKSQVKILSSFLDADQDHDQYGVEIWPDILNVMGLTDYYYSDSFMDISTMIQLWSEGKIKTEVYIT